MAKQVSKRAVKKLSTVLRTVAKAEAAPSGARRRRRNRATGGGSSNNNSSSSSSSSSGLGLATAGTALGSYFGGPVGGILGGLAGGLIGKITGLGTYKISGPGQPFQIPVMANSPDAEGGYVVTRREYIGDISSSTTFTSTQYPINPGLLNVFPWLSNLASNFEEYRIRGLAFCFKSTSADALNSTNTALGSVIIAAQYDEYDASFSSKLEMENYQGAVSCKPSENMMYGLECRPSISGPTHLYVRTSSNPPGDIRLYDLARVTVATVGSQATAVIGELWMTYDIVFYKPKLYTTPSNNFWSHASFVNPAFGATPTATSMNSSAIVASSTSTGTISYTGGGATSFQINFSNPGTYLILVTAGTSSSSSGSWTVANTTNAGLINSTSGLGTVVKSVSWANITPTVGNYYQIFTPQIDTAGTISASAAVLCTQAAIVPFTGSGPKYVVWTNPVIATTSASVTADMTCDVVVVQLPSAINATEPKGLDERLSSLEKKLSDITSRALDNFVMVRSESLPSSSSSTSSPSYCLSR